jgi:hypothetical protein
MARNKGGKVRDSKAAWGARLTVWTWLLQDEEEIAEAWCVCAVEYSQ